MRRGLVVACVMAGCASASRPPVVPEAPPSSIAGTGAHSCSATISCYSACPAPDQACFATCEAGATQDAYHASHAFLNCLVREHCYGEACAKQACPDELALCGLSLVTITGPL